MKSEREQILSLLQRIPESRKNDMFLLLSEKTKDEMLLASLQKMSPSEQKQAFLMAGLSAAQSFGNITTEDSQMEDADAASVVSNDGDQPET